MGSTAALVAALLVGILQTGAGAIEGGHRHLSQLRFGARRTSSPATQTATLSLPPPPPSSPVQTVSIVPSAIRPSSARPVASPVTFPAPAAVPTFSPIVSRPPQSPTFTFVPATTVPSPPPRSPANGRPSPSFTVATPSPVLPPATGRPSPSFAVGTLSPVLPPSDMGGSPVAPPTTTGGSRAPGATDVIPPPNPPYSGQGMPAAGPSGPVDPQMLEVNIPELVNDRLPHPSDPNQDSQDSISSSPDELPAVGPSPTSHAPASADPAAPAGFPSTVGSPLTGSPPGLGSQGSGSLGTPVSPGSEASSNSTEFEGYTYVVSLRSPLQPDFHRCAGVLIGESEVLTEAHCVDPRLDDLAAHYPIAIIGREIFSQQEDGEVISTVDVAYHPEYGASSILGFHDLAILKLERPTSFEPLKLPPQDFQLEYGDWMIGVAWGRLLQNSITSDTLQLFATPFIPADICTRQGVPTDLVGDGTFCIGGREEIHGTICEGDDGSPLIVNKKFLVGMVGLTSTCGQGHNIDVVTDVITHAEWIRENLEK